MHFNLSTVVHSTLVLIIWKEMNTEECLNCSETYCRSELDFDMSTACALDGGYEDVEGDMVEVVHHWGIFYGLELQFNPLMSTQRWCL